MVKQIIADTFETLGGVVQSAGQQVVTDVKKMGGDVAEQLGLKQPPKQIQDDKSQAPAQTQEQDEKIRQAAQKRTIAHYEQINAEIKAIGKAIGEKRKRELPKEVTGKPGFSEEKAIKQLEEKKPSSAEATAGKEKLPPLPARQASRKTEMFRGASG